MTSVTDASSAPASNPGSAASASLLGDYNMFLQLLTTQMTNQDPLDPMDTAEYTQQLVQYSQVEQSIQQTGRLDDILGQLLSQQMAQSSSYIGREARFDSPVAGLAESPARWTYEVDGTPATLVATISNAMGREVANVTLEPGASSGGYVWDGTLADGTLAAPGAYTLSLRALAADGSRLETGINSLGRVEDVVSEGGEILLGVNGIRFSARGLVGLTAGD